MDFPGQIGPAFVKKVMPWVELIWNNKNRYPLPDEFYEKFKFTPEQVALLDNSKFWNNALKARGIVRFQGSLTEKQVAAVSLLTNFSDRRAIPVKMAAIGVSAEQLDGWYRDPTFKRELEIRTDQAFEVTHSEIQASLIRQAQKGNMAAIKMYYEVTGKSQSPEAINLRAAITRILEILQKHVDPETMAVIAAEILSEGTNGNFNSQPAIIQA